MINKRSRVEAFDDEVRLCLDVGLAPLEHGSLTLDLELENEHPNETQDQLFIAINEVCFVSPSQHQKRKRSSEKVVTRKKQKKKETEKEDKPSPDRVSLMS